MSPLLKTIRRLTLLSVLINLLQPILTEVGNVLLRAIKLLVAAVVMTVTAIKRRLLQGRVRFIVRPA